MTPIHVIAPFKLLKLTILLRVLYKRKKTGRVKINDHYLLGQLCDEVFALATSWR